MKKQRDHTERHMERHSLSSSLRASDIAPEKISLETYRRWLTVTYPLLILGSASAWTEYHAWKNALLTHSPNCSVGRLPTLDEFLARPLDTKTVCAGLEIDLPYLMRLEKKGIIGPPSDTSCTYSPEEGARIYWAVFFQREMGLDDSGTEALLWLLKHLSPFMARHMPITKNMDPEAQTAHEHLGDTAFCYSASIAEHILHDIGSPLHVIGGRADLLRRKLANVEVAVKNLSIIQEHVKKIIDILKKYQREERNEDKEALPSFVAHQERSTVHHTAPTRPEGCSDERDLP